MGVWLSMDSWVFVCVFNCCKVSGFQPGVTSLLGVFFVSFVFGNEKSYSSKKKKKTSLTQPNFYL